MEVIYRNGLVQTVDSGGNYVQLSEEEAKSALAQGYRPASQEEVNRYVDEKEHSTIGQRVLAGVEGAASTATFGGSDYLGSKILGKDWAEDRQKRAEYNPVSSGVGSAAGLVLPALIPIPGAGTAAGKAALGAGLGARSLAAARTVLTPGLAAEARIAQAARTLGVGDSVLARTAGMAASGAVEGGLYAAGREVSDAALNNTDLTAERLITALGHGAAYGGLAGGGIGLGAASLGKLGSSIANKVRAGDNLEDLTSLATKDKLNKVVNNQEKIINELGLTPNRTERFISKMESAVNEAETIAVQAGKKSDDALRELVSVRRSNALAEQKTLVAKLDEVGAKVETGPAFERLKAQAQKLQSEPINDYVNLGKSLEKDINKAEEIFSVSKQQNLFGEAAKASSFSTFYKLQQKLEAKIDNAVKKKLITKADGGDIKNAFTNSLDDSLDKTDDIFGKLASEGDEFAKSIIQQQGGLKQAFKKSKEDYLDYKLLEDNLKEIAKVEQVSLLNKVKELVKENAIDAAKSAGAGAALATVSGQDPLAGAGAGVAGVIGPRAITSRLIGNVAKQKAMRYAADRGSAGIGLVGQKIHQHNQSINSAARALVTGVKRAAVVGVVAATEKEQRKQFEQVKKQLADLNDENKKAEFLANATSGLDNHEELKVAAQNVILQDLEYVRSKMPLGFSKQDPFKFDAEPTYTKDQIRKINNIVTALYRPEQIIEDLNKGQIDLAAIQALKDRRPTIYTEIRTAIIRNAVANPDSISYKRKLLINAAFDFKQIDWSTKNAQMLQSLGEEKEEGPGRPKSSKLSGEMAEQMTPVMGIGNI